MPHRDPETGQFLSHEDTEPDEQLTLSGELVVPASDLGGQTAVGYGQQGTFEGLQLLDMDEVLDRDEIAVMREAWHTTHCTIPATQTADGTARASVEFSASPSRQVAGPVADGQDIPDTGGDFAVQASGLNTDDSVDLIGPILDTLGHGSFSDGATGVGGGGMTDVATWRGTPVEPVFDPRDELYLNGAIEQNNVADASIHVSYSAQYHFDVAER